MDEIHLDCETYSKQDITLGAHKYAEHPTTRMLIAAVSTQDNILAWQNPIVPCSDTSHNQRVKEILQKAVRDKTPIYAHNASFENAICYHRLLKDMGIQAPDISQWRCTAAMCRSAAIHHSLDKAAAYLKVEQKNKAGKRLISLFSKGEWKSIYNKKSVTVLGESMSVEAAWQMFVEYCRQDVVAEMAIHKKLKAYELKGWLLDHFHFDMRMNQRGLPCNEEAAKHAVTILNNYSAKMQEEFRGMTGIAPSQTKRFTEWAKDHGYPQHLKMGKADVIEAVSTMKGDEPWAEALKLKSKLSFSAVAKIPTMLETICDDKRIRDTFLFWGALRTGRHSAGGIQPQNFKRPDADLEKDTHVIYQMMKNKCGVDDIEMFYGDTQRAIASCIRHFLEDSDHKILDADFSNIEARCLVWLAGQEDRLQMYKDGVDMYCLMGSLIYGFTVNKKDHKFERFIGKVAELACGYGGSLNAFVTMAKGYGVDVPPKLADKAIKSYRQNNPMVVKMWKQTGECFANAIRNPNKKYTYRGITFERTSRQGFDAVLITLLSGRVLTYPEPKVEKKLVKIEATEVRAAMEFEADAISYYGKVKDSTIWARIYTHGGKITENITQATAGDFLAYACLNLEKKKYEPIAVIHDQCLATYRPEMGDSPEEFASIMKMLPEWAEGFPLDATCAVVPYYMKDE